MSNFDFIPKEDKYFFEIFSACQTAEEKVFSDHSISIACARMGLERMVKALYRAYELGSTEEIRWKSLDDLIEDEKFRAVIDDEYLIASLQRLRQIGNRGIHESENTSEKDAKNALLILHSFAGEMFYEMFEIEVPAFDWDLVPRIQSRPSYYTDANNTQLLGLCTTSSSNSSIDDLIQEIAKETPLCLLKPIELTDDFISKYGERLKRVHFRKRR